MRWDRVSSTADFLNGIGASASSPPPTPFFSPFSSTRNRFTPGVQFLIHANIKASFEYQVRPKQVVYNPGHGTTSKPVPYEHGYSSTGICVLTWGGAPPRLFL